MCCVKPSPPSSFFFLCALFCQKRKKLLKLLKGSRSPASMANTEIENLEPQCADFCPLLFFQRILGATLARILRSTFSLAGD